MEISLGVVGCGYGKNVLIPAFRADRRCRVVAVAAGSLKTAELTATELGIDQPHADWSKLVSDPGVDAVAVSVPPYLQPEIVLGALGAGKPVFAEKPLAVTLADARCIASEATRLSAANMVDFNFAAITAFMRARAMLQQNAIGRLRHVVVNWQTESYTNRLRIENWKSTNTQGGGTLSNFVSHCLHYLEWFAGPIMGISARLFHLPDDSRLSDSTVSLAMKFLSGAAGMLAMSAAAFPGSGHRIEFYGEDGSLILENTSRDYMRGFRLLHSDRRSMRTEEIALAEPDEDRWQDGRILPVSRLAKQFFDWVEHKTPGRPNFNDGLRVQELLTAAEHSHRNGVWVDLS